MSSSTDIRPTTFQTLTAPQDVRTGHWTRLGSSQVVGDPVTEAILAELSERVRAAAEAQGYASGWAQGMRDAQADYDAKVAARDADDAVFREQMRQQQADAAQRLTATGQAVRDAVAAAVAETNAAAVQLAFDLVQVLLGRELALATDPGTDAITRALDLAQGQKILELRLSPADIAITDLTDLQNAGIQVVPDSTLSSGDAIADTGDSVLDASIRSAVDRLREQWSQ
jgi:flagellar assembly protein FliH